MNKLVLCVALLSGCAGADEVLPRAGHTLEAVKEAYQAICYGELELKAQCVEARRAINEAVEVYTAVNDSVGE